MTENRKPAEQRTRDVAEDRAPPDLAQSKRQPRRDRSNLAASGAASAERPRRAPKAEPAAPDTTSAEAAAPESDSTPKVQSVPTPVTKEAKEVKEVKEVKAEVAALEPGESSRAPDAQPQTVPAAVAAPPPATPIGEKGRAANDPREVRRRQREDEMRDQGINK